jgi:hypothetical protein
MLIRYLHLAMFVATALSQRTSTSANSNDMDRQLGDLSWDIQPEDGYPIIGFNNNTEESEVAFKYNFTGTLSDRKFLDAKLYQNDCVSASDASLAFTNTTSGDELDVDVDIIQETIKKSVHYQDLNGTAAIIGFCLRVDYNYVNDDGNTEIVMFYETNVTINVDLTSNFTLTELVIDYTLASGDAVEAELDYGVEAFICLEDGSEVMNPGALGRGAALQFCVRKNANATRDMYVADVLSMTIAQPGGNAGATASITNGSSDTRTDKVCRNGICSVKTQLSSKFFNPRARIPDHVGIPDAAAAHIAAVPDAAAISDGEVVGRGPVFGGSNGNPGNMGATGSDPGNGCENQEEVYSLPNSGEGKYTGDNEVVIEIHYDDYPVESGWTIKTSTGDYITGLCTGFFSTKDVVVSNTVYVDEGTYIFEMTDDYGDGLCCGYGEGRFSINVNGVKVENDITFDFQYAVQLSFDVVGSSGGGARRLEDIPIVEVEGVDIPIVEVEGVAVLAFGRRRLRAPIRGLLTGSNGRVLIAAQHQESNDKETKVTESVQRILQNGGAPSGFGLQIELQDDLTSESNSQGSGRGSDFVGAVVVLIALAGGCGLGFLFCTRRDREEDKEEDTVDADLAFSFAQEERKRKAASIDTYPINRVVVCNVLIPKSA